MPSSLAVDLTLDNSDVRLDLQRDTDFQPDLPVYVLSTDSAGKQQIKRAKLIDTEYAVYYDPRHEAAFGVFREKDSNGSMQYKMEGIVHSEGKIYDLKSTGQTHKVRRRRDVASSTNTTTDANADNNGQKNAEEADEEEEEEEFEIEVFLDAAAVGSDSLPKPPMILRQKTMLHLNMSQPYRVGGTPTPLRALPTLPPHPHRRRRQVTQDVYIDVVALADYGVYKTWYDRSNATTTAAKQQDTLEKIRRYYAFVMNGVNMLYSTITSLPYKIHVRLSSVVIAAVPGSSDWTEQYRVKASQWDEVDANLALKAVSNWAATTDMLPAYDHLMVFSGYDLSKTVDEVTSDKITGLAYTGTVCDTNGKATSIVEDLGGFQCIGTAAHELGHGLSAEHDGTENVCRSEDRYVMAAGTYDVTTTNKLNPWRFSSCSVSYFNSFFKNELRFARGQQCIYNSLGASSSVPNVTSLVEGQLYDPDEQCRQVYGPESRLCRGPEFGKAEDVCTDMFCYDPTTSATCYQLVAARGTTCGNKKWCESGQCLSNNAAPAVDESCVFGDQPGIAFDNTDCETFVANFPGYCYQDVVRVRCCSSCAKHHLLLQNCEYGDKATGCNTGICPSAETEYLQSCCGTCNYGTPLTTTATTTTSTRTTTTRAPAVVTTMKPTTTMRGTSGPVTSAPGTCFDNATITINQMDCRTLATSSPNFCYDSRVISLCCESCRQVVTGIKGCEFGDRRPSECGIVSFERDACSTLQPVCCKSCAGYQSPTGGQAASTSITTSVLIFFLGVALLLTQGVV
ncbi:A disintegrin and metalloproteinase with thrombospondin motifs 10-like isoform X2 [Littorina saxatilis]|uniref:A disintegrin and metalloproteinase with thrombospondin motifs 10-like isoform X2 n=1 Tax=Littorina saxatilis TaxID=31220 RepID=UPI0038B6A82D